MLDASILEADVPPACTAMWPHDFAAPADEPESNPAPGLTSCLSGADDSIDNLTTIMLRNIPNRVQVPDVQKFLDENGFSGVYDIIVVPSDNKTRRNRGYCFVNFVSGHYFRRAMIELGGLRLDNKASAKVTEVSIAAQQLSKDDIEPDVEPIRPPPGISLEGA
mmetsp:Transcript_57660/g.154057  ORF Transcript_57660/g.154057 Transcript_57660/m.154057 type:complete len:164 (-) Transcript_57660:126-617(-)